MADGNPLSGDLIARFIAIVGADNAITDTADQQPFVTEWRDLYFGKTPAVLKPGSTEEVAAILRLAHETGTPIVPQGGNTGTNGGAVPHENGDEIVLSLARLNRVRAFDPIGATMTVEAGCVLHTLQTLADENDLYFPLGLGSEGSCQIGGNISTNAGGTAVLAFGNTRDLVLGLEVVLPDGRIWNGLSTLRKNNTGYDLKNLFIGAEGTLGVVTAATLKLFPRPKRRETAFVGIASPHDGLALLKRLQQAAGPMLTSCEIMPRLGLEFCLKHLAGARDPLGAPHAWYLLVELSSGDASERVRETMENVLMAAIEDEIVQDAALAESDQQAAGFWHIRTGLSEVQKSEGGSIKHDIAVPVKDIAAFIDEAAPVVEAITPGARVIAFGHLGDGNLHYNVSQPADYDQSADKARYLAQWDEMNAAVYAVVKRFDGTISAEHGIGRLKRKHMPAIKDPVELAMMQEVKALFDPRGIMNPGKVLP